jgi:predicted nucleotidyltransferase
MYGLADETMTKLIEVFSFFPHIEKVVLYGSRAKGNHRNGSDVDITLLGKALTLENSVYPLLDKLEELYLPYTFDISIFEKLSNPELVEHIQRAGKLFYQKPQSFRD